LNTGHGMVRSRALWAQLGPPGRIALGAAVLGAITLGLSSRELVGAVLTPAASTAGSGANDEKQREDQFKKSFDNHLAQINGRSMFFIPSAPRKAEGPRPVDPTPSAPTSYGGPALVGFANGAAYFADGRRLLPGDPAERSLRVKALSPPWSAVLEWEGVEFTVSLFDHDRVVFAEKKSGPAAAESAAPAAEPKPGLTPDLKPGPDSKPETAKAPTPAPTSEPPPGNSPPPGGDPPPPSPPSSPEPR
jgi:hypothetical protein